jgi:hypothetical protein
MGNKHGLINEKEQFFWMSDHHESVYPYNFSGLYPVRNIKGKYGYVNGKYEVIIPFQFDRAKGFLDNYVFKMKVAEIEIRNKCGYINEKGEIFVPPKFNRLEVEYKTKEVGGIKLRGRIEHRKFGIIPKHSQWVNIDNRGKITDFIYGSEVSFFIVFIAVLVISQSLTVALIAGAICLFIL